MYHDPHTSRDQLLNRLQRLATNGAALYERALTQPMTARDLAQAIEYNQQYIEILTELEEVIEIEEVEVAL
jgi:hypothetical protein